MLPPPDLGKLATEAEAKGKEFGESSAVRAMVLYPMNALVNDQLDVSPIVARRSACRPTLRRLVRRPARFARYTSRTLYPGVRDKDKDQDRLKPIGKYYVKAL